MSDSTKTPLAAKRLKATYHQLIGLIRYGKIPAPRKDSSGDYVWSADDLDRARKALKAGRQRKVVPA